MTSTDLPSSDVEMRKTNKKSASVASARSRPRSRAGQLACHGAVLVAPPKRRVFPGLPDQVAHARKFVARVLDRCPVTIMDTALLLTSELVTNTLRHTGTADGGTFEVIVWRGLAATCIAILDGGSDSTPIRHAPDQDERIESAEPAESGHGLVLVDALATRWGYRRYDEGTAVWFLLRWATAPSPSSCCRGRQEGAS
jgi:anti-sigma regulatory factor (Ser/Thr protein kinase)